MWGIRKLQGRRAGMAQKNQGLLRNTSTLILALSCQALRPKFSLLGRWNDNGMETWDPDEAHGCVSVSEGVHFPRRQAGPPTLPVMSQAVSVDPEISGGLTTRSPSIATDIQFSWIRKALEKWTRKRLVRKASDSPHSRAVN